MLARAVDVRRLFQIPEGCTGPISNACYQSLGIEELLKQSLGFLATRLRAALSPGTSKIAQETRKIVSFLHRTPDKSVAVFGANLDLSKDIQFTSWVKLNSYSLDFGLGLGKPAAVRIPKMEPVEGLVVLLPKTREGDAEVVLCMRDEDLERLRTDEAFTKYVQWIG